MKRTSRIALYLASIFTLLMLPSGIVAAAAPTPRVSLSATTPTTREIGQTVGVEVQVENSDTAAVKIHLRYDAAKLRYESLSQTGSSFAKLTLDTATAGSISIDASSGTGDASAPRRIISLTFRAEQTGNAVTAFDGVNQIQVQNCLLFLCNKVYKDATTGPDVTFTLKAVESSSPSSVTPTSPTATPGKHETSSPKTLQPHQTNPNTSSSPKQPSAPGRQPTAPDFAIQGLSLSQITSSTATVTLETTAPSTGVLIYGAEGATDMKQLPVKSRANSHTLDLRDLMPSTNYMIQVIMEDGSGKTVRSTVPFQTLSVVTAATQSAAYSQTTNPTTKLVGTMVIAGIGTAIGLMIVGWVLRRGTKSLHSATVLEASVLASRRYTLRRFGRLR